MHIAVIGSCNVDITVEASRRPHAGETIIGNKLLVSPGGKGANQAVAAARLGAKVYMVGCVGDDAYGQMMIESLHENRVDTTYVITKKGVSTGTAHITLAEGDNSIIVLKGANDLVGIEEIDRAWSIISTAEIVLLQYEIPMDTIAYVIKKCKEQGIKVLLNPAPFTETPREWMQSVAYITPNEHEAKLLFEGQTRDELLAMYPDKMIMTIGAEGVAYNQQGNHTVIIPGIKVPVVDTTGAGDTFNGAFAVSITEGLPIKEAIAFANAAAAYSVQKIGAQGGMPLREELEDMLLCKK
ncbi:MAG: ribokinase [Dialister sp.]|nr:ribokinase [Dialister sp.]